MKGIKNKGFFFFLHWSSDNGFKQSTQIVNSLYTLLRIFKETHFEQNTLPFYFFRFQMSLLLVIIQ